MSKILKADFSNAREGDKIKTVYGFEGKITKKTNWADANKQRWVMEFEQLNGANLTIEFDDDGYVFSNGYKYSKVPVVFYPFEGQLPTIESCTRPLPKIEVDEKVLYFNERAKKWLPGYANGIDNDGKIRLYPRHMTSWAYEISGCGGLFFYPIFWKLDSDPTINSGNLDKIEGENE